MKWIPLSVTCEGRNSFGILIANPKFKVTTKLLTT